MNKSLENVLKALEQDALAFCSESDWAIVVAECERAGNVRRVSKSAQVILQKAMSRSEAGRYAAEQRWKNHQPPIKEGSEYMLPDGPRFGRRNPPDLERDTEGFVSHKVFRAKSVDDAISKIKDFAPWVASQLLRDKDLSDSRVKMDPQYREDLLDAVSDIEEVKNFTELKTQLVHLKKIVQTGRTGFKDVQNTSSNLSRLEGNVDDALVYLERSGVSEPDGSKYKGKERWTKKPDRQWKFSRDLPNHLDWNSNIARLQSWKTKDEVNDPSGDGYWTKGDWNSDDPDYGR